MTETKHIPVIAVVGGIGSGKSSVARALAVRGGGYLVQADELGHEGLRQADVRAQIVARWGTGILDDQGQIVRRRLGEIVFSDRSELRRLEGIVFPYIGKRIEEERRKAAGLDKPFIVLDAAVILEAGWTKALDRLVYVDAPRDVRVGRLKQRGWSEGELARREKNQMPLDEKRRRADAVIENRRDLEALEEQVDLLLKKWELV